MLIKIDNSYDFWVGQKSAQAGQSWLGWAGFGWLLVFKEAPRVNDYGEFIV